MTKVLVKINDGLYYFTINGMSESDFKTICNNLESANMICLVQIILRLKEKGVYFEYVDLCNVKTFEYTLL